MYGQALAQLGDHDAAIERFRRALTFVPVDWCEPYQAMQASLTALGEAAAPFGVSGVAVTNGPAGTAPTYSRIDGRMQPVTAEYQLCFKCHSGWTEQLANDPARPSRDRTDLGMAFNPENKAYHPVEAAGKNQTPKMADSLAGTSSHKLWNLRTTDTISCTMCHTSSAGPTSSSTACTRPASAPGAPVAPTSTWPAPARATPAARSATSAATGPRTPPAAKWSTGPAW